MGAERVWWSRWKWVVIGTTLPIVVFLLWWFATRWLVEVMGAKDWAERGQLGDQFGAVNALFSGLALAGVVVAIMIKGRSWHFSGRSGASQWQPNKPKGRFRSETSLSAALLGQVAP